MEEVWKDIKDWEGFYQCSNLGRIKSLARSVSHKRYGLRRLNERILRQGLNNANYYIVVLCNNTYRKTYKVHKLIARTLLPNPHNLIAVNHKDEDSKNNRVDNLEWCTLKYNSNYGTATKRHSEKIERKVKQIKNDVVIKVWDSIKEAATQNKTFASNIVACLKGRQKTCNGYEWQYT